jgi:hypothetical protein
MSEAFSEYLTKDEVAKKLHRKTSWVKAHSNGNRQPTLPSIKFGKERLYRPEGVQLFMIRLEEEEKVRLERKLKRLRIAC